MNSQEQKKYFYAGVVVKVVDGDTVDIDVDLGFHVTTRQRFRLAEIDAPEMKTNPEPAKKAREELKKLIMEKKCTITSHKGDRYGRWVARLIVDGIDASEYMLQNGWVKKYEGAK